jgi:hypothetical protein
LREFIEDECGNFICPYRAIDFQTIPGPLDVECGMWNVECGM